MHIVFQFDGDMVQVAELLALSNAGDKTFQAAQPDSETLAFPLPLGYTNLAFQDGALGDLYLLTEAGFADTSPIAPGENTRQILLSFSLPYPEGLAFSQTVPYPVSEANVLLPAEGVTLSNGNLTDAGVQDMQGSKFHLYSVAGLESGQTIAFELTGRPPMPQTAADANGGASLAPAFDWRSLTIGGLSLAIVLALIVYGWVNHKETVGAAVPQPRSGALAPARPAPGNRPESRRAQEAANHAARIEELLTEIAELDEGFENGEYPETDYRKERETLKKELKRLMEKA